MLTHEAGSICPRGMFRCNQGICIEMIKRCDGLWNCGDGSDETDCREYISFVHVSIMFFKICHILA